MHTRRTFNEVASILHDARTDVREGMTPEAVLAEVGDRFAGMFAADNPRFDRDRFLRAIHNGKGGHEVTIARKHQESIARDTLRMPDAMAAVMGGPTKEEAARVLADPVMDRETAEHFYAWLDRTVPADEQHEVEEQILALLREHPDLVGTHSWPEMRRMVE
jgi:hypothetical protein